MTKAGGSRDDETRGTGDSAISATEAPSRPSPAARRRDARSGPATEREINAPDRRTLLMLGAVTVVTLACWGAARLSCNITDPVNKAPPPIPLERLAATPKHAAIELSYRWRIFDPEQAMKLARGNLRERIARDLEKCQADPVECRRKRGELKGRVLTTATVLRQDARVAEVRVINHVQGSGDERYLMTLEHQGRIWKGTDQRPE